MTSLKRAKQAEDRGKQDRLVLGPMLSSDFIPLWIVCAIPEEGTNQDI